MKTTHLTFTKARIAQAAVTVAAGMVSLTGFGADEAKPVDEAKAAEEAKPAADAKPPPDAKPPEKKHWETSASAGLTLARGNSHSFMVAAGLNSSRKWSKDEVLLGANGGYGKNTTVQRVTGESEVTTKTEDYLKGFGQWNHLFTERLYGGMRIEGLHDDIADINYRFTFSPLAGYYFIKRPATTLAGEFGPSYIYEQVAEDTQGYWGLRLGERFEHKFRGGARIWQTAEIIPQLSDWDNYIINAELGAEAPVNKKLSLRVVLQDSYDNVPAKSSTPTGTYNRLKNDLKLIAGAAYKF